MSDGTKTEAPLLMAMLVLLAGLAVALIVMGMYPVGIAILAVAIALLPTSIKSVTVGKGDDAG